MVLTSLLVAIVIDRLSLKGQEQRLHQWVTMEVPYPPCCTTSQSHLLALLPTKPISRSLCCTSAVLSEWPKASAKPLLTF